MLSLEPEIISRLQLQVPAITTVASATYLAGVDDISPQLPAAYVQPDAAQYADMSPDGSGIETQTWRIDVCVPFVRDAADVVTAASIASPLLQAIAAALHGWTPADSGYSPLLITGRPQPVYPEDYKGFALFPINFQTTRVVVDFQ